MFSFLRGFFRIFFFLFQQKDKVVNTLTSVQSDISAFSSDYKRKRSYQSSSYYIPPISQGCALKSSKKKNIFENKSETFEFVKITETIKKLFKNKPFRDDYFSQKTYNCVEGIYEDFCCGSYSKQPPFSLLKGDELPPVEIQLFCDATVINDGKNKNESVTAFYFSIRNISKYLLSHLANIHLVALAFSHSLKNKLRDFVGHDLNIVVDLIVKDLKELEKGIEIEWEEDGITFKKIIKGTLVLCINDNLGWQELLGLVESFTAAFFCRYHFLFL